MIKFEEITSMPTFSSQLENKILYTNHSDDISISYKSTYTLKYVLEGTKYYNFNHQSIAVSKNQYLILNNNQITTDASKGTKGWSFFLSPELIQDIYNYHTDEEANLDFFEITQRKSDNSIGVLLDEIIRFFEQNSLLFKYQMDNLFIRLTEAIVQEQANIEGKFEALSIVKYHTKKELFKLISLTKEYLNDNIRESISLDKISKSIGISKYYLHRIFTEINGSTPLAYLTYIRLERAKHKLQSSKASILEIAMECGFDNISYFSNTFKKHIGCSPTQYRKSL